MLFVPWQDMELQPTHEVINVLRSVSTLHGQTQLLGILLRREGPDYQIDGHPGINWLEVLVAVRLERLLKEVSVCHFWGAMRLAAALLKKTYPSVMHMTAILVQGCQVT
ncbi:Phosphorylase b kinase regulatory subunit beta [Portunus trituberculatus]|uniref:Phosphorylase b kinase regulatory subunit beta n=1 Tax=Portunus trituberculatus TaxID=210409 RepID=A0A5B7IEX5_PORTR|nr:Phosphorylase b kinase regulatory subunit beta [Portunus trituberculatus]